MSYTVYEHITPSGKRYIGITSKANPNLRWQNGSHYKKGTAFRCAIDKYSWNNIQHNILFDDLTEKEAKWLENYLICYYRTFVGFNDCKGYNMTLGGEGTVGSEPWNKGKHFSPETCKKISESHKGKTPWNKGKKCGPLSEQHKQKMSESRKGRISGMKGKHHSKETCIKISESHKGKPSNTKGKHWKLIDGKRVYYE